MSSNFCKGTIYAFVVQSSIPKGILVPERAAPNWSMTGNKVERVLLKVKLKTVSKTGETMFYMVDFWEEDAFRYIDSNIKAGDYVCADLVNVKFQAYTDKETGEVLPFIRATGKFVHLVTPAGEDQDQELFAGFGNEPADEQAGGEALAAAG